MPGTGVRALVPLRCRGTSLGYREEYSKWAKLGREPSGSRQPAGERPVSRHPWRS